MSWLVVECLQVLAMSYVVLVEVVLGCLAYRLRRAA